MKHILLTLALGAIATGAYAQEETKLEVKPSGRVLFDGGLFDANEQNDKLNDGFAVPDVRMGVKAKYGQWAAGIDIGYAYGKVGMKNINIDYNFDKHNYIRAGYFIHHFGFQSSTSSSFKETMEEPDANQPFSNSRLVGVMYVHNAKHHFGTLSFFSEGDAMKMTSDKLGNQGVGVMTRQLYRPFTAPGRIFHVGVSAAYESPRYNADAALNHHSYTLRSTFPTRIASVVAQEVTVTDAKGLVKISPEMVGAYGRLGFTAQGYYMNISRKNDLKSYKASGVYGVVRGLIKGSNYKYSYGDGGFANPEPGSMELVASYNYSDLSDHKAGICGGRLNDYALTYNYYINKYIIWRVRGSFTHVTDRAGYAKNSVRMIETRLQFKF